MVAHLSVNLNAVALLRNRRDLPWPSVVGIGRAALRAGARGLTVHPRPDQRHIRFTDLEDLKLLLEEEFAAAGDAREFNVEGYPTSEFLDLVSTHPPDQVTLVPDHPSQATSDHGWRFAQAYHVLEPAVERLKRNGSRVSLFCDPDAGEDELRLARGLGADRIELYTGLYGSTFSDRAAARARLQDLRTTAERAARLGLGVNAGHDLTVANLPALALAIPHLAEVSIGHGLTADALSYGMQQTVCRFLTALGAGAEIAPTR